MEDQVPPCDRSVQINKVHGKYVLIKKKATKAEIRRREYITDGRKLYAQMFLQVYNSGDFEKMEAMLKKLCTPDITTIGVFENAPGDINPIGANSTETIGYSAHMSYTESFFKAAPDLVFEGEFDNAYIDPVTKIALSRCKMRITGTRILDVKYDSKIPIQNVRTARKKRTVKKKVSKEENELMTQMHELLASSYNNESPQESAWECGLLTAEACCSMGEEGSFVPSPDSHETDQNPPSTYTAAPSLPPAPLLPAGVNLISEQYSLNSICPTTTTTTSNTNSSSNTNINSNGNNISNTVSPKINSKLRKRKGDEGNTAPSDADIDELTAKMSSLFAEREVIRLTDSKTLSVDMQPLQQSITLDYSGTFTVYFNEQNKVCRTEWVYAQKQPQVLGDNTSSEGDAASEGELGNIVVDAAAGDSS